MHSSWCSGCKKKFQNLYITILKNTGGDRVYCEKCYREKAESDEKMKRLNEDLVKENKRMKIIIETVPTHIMPRYILDDYKEQNIMDYQFLCKDGVIHVSQLALDHSDFYNDMCKGSVHI